MSPNGEEQKCMAGSATRKWPDGQGKDTREGMDMVVITGPPTIISDMMGAFEGLPFQISAKSRTEK